MANVIEKHVRDAFKNKEIPLYKGIDRIIKPANEKLVIEGNEIRSGGTVWLTYDQAVIYAQKIDSLILRRTFAEKPREMALKSGDWKTLYRGATRSIPFLQPSPNKEAGAGKMDEEIDATIEIEDDLPDLDDDDDDELEEDLSNPVLGEGPGPGPGGQAGHDAGNEPADQAEIEMMKAGIMLDEKKENIQDKPFWTYPCHNCGIVIHERAMQVDHLMPKASKKNQEGPDAAVLLRLA